MVMEDKVTPNELSREFWEERWLERQTGWDMGKASPALLYLAEKYVREANKVLIPGCGNAHEADPILKMGYKDITLMDISTVLVNNLKKRFSPFPEITVVAEDFFTHNVQYDLILEQTFFCALPREMRTDYVKKMYDLLNENGILAGVLFSEEFEKEGPPFGGTYVEYQELFAPYFIVHSMENNDLSIPERKNKEFLFTCIKRKL